jgi:hypothetical protein
VVPKKATPLFLVYGGDALDGLAYRVVERCPPTETDFLSYEALGKPYDRRDFFKGTGLSMHTTRKRSQRIAQTYGVGSAVAVLDLRHPSIVWARTGGADHLTVWAPPEILLARVLECERNE